ncbi:sensor histidine kinase [Chitinophagaceae bacterium LWZ2-11]
MSFLEKVVAFNKNYRVLSHILFWIIIWILSISASTYYESGRIPIVVNLVDDGLSLIAQIMASYFLAYFIIPKFFKTKKYILVFIFFIIGSYVICVISRLLVIHVAEPFSGVPPKSSETIEEILTNLLKLVYVYFFRIFSIAFVFLFLKLLKDQSEIQKKTLSLEKEKVETELKLLKAQLNPHFLFNTLNNVYSLSVNNSPATSASIGRLAEILDYILYRCNALFVPLSGEINLLKNYIELEKLRYDDRLQVRININVDHDIEIAPLILLSVVENAFKHGAGQDIGNPVIDIDLQVSNNLFRFKVVNSFTKQQSDTSAKKIGLENLSKQLQLIYGDHYTLEIKQTEETFSVIITIDIKE